MGFWEWSFVSIEPRDSEPESHSWSTLRSALEGYDWLGVGQDEKNWRMSAKSGFNTASDIAWENGVGWSRLVASVKSLRTADNIVQPGTQTSR